MYHLHILNQKVDEQLHPDIILKFAGIILLIFDLYEYFNLYNIPQSTNSSFLYSYS